MARFLFVVPPFGGHIQPTIPLGKSLRERGHEVAWVGHAEVLGELLPQGFPLIPLPKSSAEMMNHELYVKSLSLIGIDRFRFLFEEILVPLAESMLPGVEEAVARFAPDVLLVDHQAYAGGLLAKRRGLRWATLATTPAQFDESMDTFPKLKEWKDRLLQKLEQRAGLPAGSFEEASPLLLLVFSVKAFCAPNTPASASVHFVGPSALERREDFAFPWERVSPGPKILVSLGTVNMGAGRRFFNATFEAFRGQDLQVILVAHEDCYDRPEGGVPENFLIGTYVPQLALLKRVDAVVTHGGHNTVMETLSHGLPMVVTPITDDQPVIGKMVEASGAGLTLRFRRITPTMLRDGVQRVLKEPAYRAAALRLKQACLAAGGAERAASLMEDLLARS